MAGVSSIYWSDFEDIEDIPGWSAGDTSARLLFTVRRLPSPFILPLAGAGNRNGLRQVNEADSIGKWRFRGHVAQMTVVSKKQDLCLGTEVGQAIESGPRPAIVKRQ